MYIYRLIHRSGPYIHAGLP